MKRFVFRLYVAGTSANSMLAVSNLEQFCSELPQDCFEIEIIDVVARPKIALTAEIVVTPTLDVGAAGTTRRVIGTLHDTSGLRSLLGRLNS